MRLPLILALGILGLAASAGLFSESAESMSGRLCKERGVCHKLAAACTGQGGTPTTVVLNTGTTTWPVPTNVTTLSKVSAIGAGAGSNNGSGNDGVGGGAYSEVDNVAVTPGNNLVLSIGSHGVGGASSTSSQAGTSGGDTSVSYLGSQILLAKGGQYGLPGNGGAASSGVGTIKFSGGNGAVGGSGAGAGGGGGAGGPNGAGQNGTAAPTQNTGQAGGAGDNGSGGSGGAGGTGAGSTGGSGAEFGAAGSGGGGGGGGGSAPGTGGNGGAYGGGAGGAGFISPMFPAGGNGGDGVVIVQYATACGGPPPPPPQNTFFVATNGNDTNPGTLAQPFLTLGQCQTAMRNSTTTKTCTIRAGTYNLASGIDFTTADNNTTWQFYTADGVNTAILDGGSTGATSGIDMFTTSCCGGQAGAAGNPSGITFNGIKFQNAKDMVFNANINNFTLKNSDLGFNHDCSELSGFAPLAAISGKNNLYSHNYFHDSCGPGTSTFAFGSNENIDGSVYDSNVYLNNCQTVGDCGVLYMDMRNTFTNGGRVTISNNFFRDYGNNSVGARAIYHDDDTSNVTSTRNIIGPPAGSNGSAMDIIFNGGASNTVTNNLIDIGSSAIVPALSAGLCGEGGTVSCSGPPTPNNFNKNIVVAKSNTTFNPNVFGNGGAFMYTEYYCAAALGGPIPGGSASAWIAISNSMYHNYGSGNMPTNGGASACGTLISDASPINQDPLCSGYLYNLAGNSPAFGAPMNFVDVSAARAAGPPGFVIPSGPNHSC